MFVSSVLVCGLSVSPSVAHDNLFWIDKSQQGRYTSKEIQYMCATIKIHKAINKTFTSISPAQATYFIASSKAAHNKL
jgi:hypothetical protein